MKNKRTTGAIVFILFAVIFMPTLARSERTDTQSNAALMSQNMKIDLRKRNFEGQELSLRFYGGLGTLVGINHFNDGYEGISNYYGDSLNYKNDHLSHSLDYFGNLDPLKFSSFGGIEIIFNIKSFAGVGIGIGYINAKKESGPIGLEGYEKLFDTDWYYLDRKAYTQKISAIPITLTFYSGIPLGKMIRIVPYFGVGLYMGRISLESSYRVEQEWVPHWVEGSTVWIAQTNTNTLGIHGGLNIDLFFTRRVGLFIGIGGLGATFKELIGDDKWKYSGYSPMIGNYNRSLTTEDALLWFGQQGWDVPQTTWYPWFFLSENDPAESGWGRNTVPAKISLSQFRFLLGVVIALGRK